MRDLSIIIISFNTRSLTQKCLQTLQHSVSNARFTYEIIVVDNSSSDGSAQMIEQEFPSVKLIKNKENIGFGRANNQGAEYAQSDTLLFLNSDIEVIDDAIEKLFSFFNTQSDRVIIGGKLFNIDKTPQPSCGPEYTLSMIFTSLFLKGDYTGMTRSSPNIIKRVDWIMGACMMMSKSLFVEVGMFDASIFMYMEEIDFQYRAKRFGAKVYFYPDAHFIHVGAASSEHKKTPIINVFRGFLFYYKKHYNSFQVFLLRILLMVKAALGVVYFSMRKNREARDVYKEALKIALS